MNGPEFWHNQESAQKVLKELKGTRRAIEPFLKVEKALEDVETMYSARRRSRRRLRRR